VVFKLGRLSEAVCLSEYPPQSKMIISALSFQSQYKYKSNLFIKTAQGRKSNGHYRQVVFIDRLDCSFIIINFKI